MQKYLSVFHIAPFQVQHEIQGYQMAELIHYTNIFPSVTTVTTSDPSTVVHVTPDEHLKL
jgi:hypothetical protein